MRRGQNPGAPTFVKVIVPPSVGVDGSTGYSPSPPPSVGGGGVEAPGEPLPLEAPGDSCAPPAPLLPAVEDASEGLEPPHANARTENTVMTASVRRIEE